MRKIYTALLCVGGLLGFLILPGCSEENAPEISVSRPVIEVICSASTTPVFVSSNAPWEAVIEFSDISTIQTENTSWCRLSKSSGKESMSINVIVDDWHELDTHRQAIIRFRTLGSNTSYATIIVKQQSENVWDKE